VKLTGKQKKGFKSDWLGHAKQEELDESALNTTKTSKVYTFDLRHRGHHGEVLGWVDAVVLNNLSETFCEIVSGVEIIISEQ